MIDDRREERGNLEEGIDERRYEERGNLEEGIDERRYEEKGNLEEGIDERREEREVLATLKRGWMREDMRKGGVRLSLLPRIEEEVYYIFQLQEVYVSFSIPSLFSPAARYIIIRTRVHQD